MDLGGLGEFGFLERVRDWVGEGSAPVGLGDDAAVLEVTPGAALVAAVDTLVAGVHFRLDWSTPADVGWKAVAVNVSDLAAMGAEPRWILVSLAAPRGTPAEVLEGFYAGLVEACADWGAELVGGDTVGAEQLVITVTALGEVVGKPLLRTGAVPGDLLAVTGPLGLAAAGVNLLLAQKPEGLAPEDALPCIEAHRRPRARVDAGRALREAGAHAALDLSDGLLSDVRRLAEASGVGVEIDADMVPVAPEVRRVAEVRGWDARRIAIAGGEDLELLVALPPDMPAPVDLPLHPVGRVVPEGLWLLGDGGREPLPEGGYDHFRSGG